jgi:flagellar hook-length control protein FliK
MQPLPAMTAVKTAPASAAVRSAAVASSVLQSTEQTAGQNVVYSSELPQPEQGQAPVTTYSDEQALCQQLAAAEQDATEQVTETQLPDSGEPASELFLLSQPLSAEELALLYRQPLLSTDFIQPLPVVLAASALPADNSNGATTAAAVANLTSAQSQPELAAMTSIALARQVTGQDVFSQTLAQQTLAEPVLTERQWPASHNLLSVSSLQALQQQAVQATAGSASQTSIAELPVSQQVLSQAAVTHSTLPHSTLQHSMALTSLLNRQFNALNGNAAWLTSTDSSAVNSLGAQATTTASSLAQWQSEPLPTEPARFGQRLVQLLQDKVDLQLGLGLNKALIRLDPPSLGSIELSVQLEGDKLQVQLHSSNAQLRDAMGQGLEQLRASLQQKLGSELQIELQLSADGQLAREAQPAWVTEQISGNAALSEMAEPLQPVMVEGRNYLNQLV